MSPIDAYVGKTRQIGAVAATHLRPGDATALATVRRELPELSVPDSLGDLWLCFNGVDGDNITLAELWLDGILFFLSVEETIEDYRVCYDLWEDDPEFEQYWPKGFLPIATPGDGSRLLVDCGAGSPTRGSVFELLHGVGCGRAAASIQQYFQTATAWLDQGALTLRADGALEIDFPKARAIAHRLNPDCDNWVDKSGASQ